MSGEGYYRNAYDYRSAIELMLVQRGPRAAARSCSARTIRSPARTIASTFVAAPDDAVLIVDSVFALRPEYDAYWDFRIWLEVEPDVAVRTGSQAGRRVEGSEEATRVRRDRYGPAEELYLAEVDPVTKADLVVDNNDFSRPRIVPSAWRRA